MRPSTRYAFGGTSMPHSLRSGGSLHASSIRRPPSRSLVPLGNPDLTGCQRGASPQNYGYRRGGISRTSAVTTPKGVTVTRTSVREYLARQRERYHRLPRADRSRLLTEMVAVTGYHRKAVLRCLSPLAPRRVSGRAVGRPRRYGA